MIIVNFIRTYVLKVILLPRYLLFVCFWIPKRFLSSLASCRHRVFVCSKNQNHTKESTMACNLCGSGDQKFKNVILLSVSFMLVFTAFQTMANIEQTVLQSITHEDPNFTGDGFVSLAIIYFFFSLCNWLAPSIVAVLGPKRTMIIGSLLYTAFIASFLWPNPYLLYSMSAVLGFGAAIIWTAQGNYLTLSSSPETMARNSGIFWAILQCSMLFGNSFVFWQFYGSKDINAATRTVVFSVLTAISVSGIVCLLFLRSVVPDGDLRANNGPPESPSGALKKSFRLLTNKKMMLLSVTFFYTGIELSFFSGVYSSAVGFTSVLFEAKRLVGLCGILVGAGEILGGASFGLLASKTVKFGRDPIVLLGFLSHIIAFYLIFINLPNESPLGPTNSVSYLNPPVVGCLMLSAFLLGFGDSCYNTQIFSILGGLFPDQSASAFALFKFTQSAAAAISFFYSSQITLAIQLSILVLFAFVGTLTFFVVEWDEASKHLIPIESTLISDDDDDKEEMVGEEENMDD